MTTNERKELRTQIQNVITAMEKDMQVQTNSYTLYKHIASLQSIDNYLENSTQLQCAFMYVDATANRFLEFVPT